mgnify:CR=1 FL=1
MVTKKTSSTTKAVKAEETKTTTAKPAEKKAETATVKAEKKELSLIHISEPTRRS